MVSDSKKKRLEAKAAKAAAEGKPIDRVKSAASLKKNASVADSLASQMEEGACLLVCAVFCPVCLWFAPRVVRPWGGVRCGVGGRHRPSPSMQNLTNTRSLKRRRTKLQSWG